MKNKFTSPTFWYGVMVVAAINVSLGATFNLHHMLDLGALLFFIGGIAMVLCL